jgi:SAM-dependent methyltransferase
MPNGLLARATGALEPVIQARGKALVRKQRRFVRRELDNRGALERFAAGDPLPPAYGVGANERVVEIPWLLAQKPQGKMLDAGSALNHTDYLDHLQPLVSQLHIVTLAYEGSAHPERGISYAYADLRALPYDDGYFDTIASVSTLEHVGMDNAGYGASTPRASNPSAEAELAVRELARVLRSGGRLFFTVPYGEREDHGTFRQLDRSDLERLIEAIQPTESSISVYRSTEDGWQLTDLERAADARYRNDFAAEAVACVRITR